MRPKGNTENIKTEPEKKPWDSQSASVVHNEEMSSNMDNDHTSHDQTQEEAMGDVEGSGADRVVRVPEEDTREDSEERQSNSSEVIQNGVSHGKLMVHIGHSVKFTIVAIQTTTKLIIPELKKQDVNLS